MFREEAHRLLKHFLKELVIMAERSMGELICALRKEKGLTQRELAEKLNATDKAVSKWERNLSCPDVGSIPALADILGLSADALLRAAKVPEPASKTGQAAKLRDTVLKALPLAMGVAVIVSSILGALDWNSGLRMLGIGLVCLALRAFIQDEK